MEKLCFVAGVAASQRGMIKAELRIPERDCEIVRGTNDDGKIGMALSA